MWLLSVQYYASTGLRTCLLIQSQDPTADTLLGQKLGNNPALFRNGNLTAIRLETTKVILHIASMLHKSCKVAVCMRMHLKHLDSLSNFLTLLFTRRIWSHSSGSRSVNSSADCGREGGLGSVFCWISSIH